MSGERFYLCRRGSRPVEPAYIFTERNSIFRGTAHSSRHVYEQCAECRRPSATRFRFSDVDDEMALQIKFKLDEIDAIRFDFEF